MDSRLDLEAARVRLDEAPAGTGLTMRNALFAVLAGLPLAAAAGEFHGHLTATTDYVFRGVSQSNTNPTLYGGLDYAHDSGVFAGLFAAAIDYPDTPFKADTGQMELDLFVGFSRPAGRDFEWDVSLIHYQFLESGSSNDNYQELALNLHYRDIARIGVAASNDAAAGGSSGWIAELELRHPLGGRYQTSGTIGRYSLAHERWRSYLYWDLGVSAVFDPVTFDLRYYDTSHEAVTFAGERLTEARVVASLSVGF
jgi:uncharacterized protein (TIGR02001 family)